MDRLAVVGTNQEYVGMRDLTVFASAAEARRAVDEQASRFRACPSEGSGPRTVTTVTPLDLGDRAWRVERVSLLDGFVSGVEAWYLVQKGTASLVVTDYVDQPEELERRDAEVRAVRTDAVEPILDELCSVRTVC